MSLNDYIQAYKNVCRHDIKNSNNCPYEDCPLHPSSTWTSLPCALFVLEHPDDAEKILKKYKQKNKKVSDCPGQLSFDDDMKIWEKK